MLSSIFKGVKESLGKFLPTSELSRRILTAIPLALLVIYAFFYKPWLARAILVIFLVICGIEWLFIVCRAACGILCRMWWSFGGIVYITFASVFWLKVIWVRPDYLMPFFLVVWAADTGAYFSGKFFGGPKLAPRISPGKTWSGALGGFLIAALVAILIKAFDPDITAVLAPFSGGFANGMYLVMIILASQLGDLAESAVKRYFGVKDSSHILPGHGGILDRLDSLLGVGVVLQLFDLLFRVIYGSSPFAILTIPH